MHKVDLLLRVLTISILLLVSSCGTHRYTPALSNEQIIIINLAEETVREGMYIDDVEDVLKEKKIKYYRDMPDFLLGGYLEKKYGNIYGIYINIAPAERVGCWDEVLMIVKFNTDHRVNQIIKEFMNICT